MKPLSRTLPSRGVKSKTSEHLPKSVENDAQLTAPLDRKEFSQETLPSPREAVTQQWVETDRDQPLHISASSNVASQNTIQVDQDLKYIESILEDGLDEVYLQLSSGEQKQFKEQGEEVAQKIREILDVAHVHVRKIIHWIMSWLRFIPHVNRFFLQQDAKLKTDRILIYAQQKHQPPS